MWVVATWLCPKIGHCLTHCWLPWGQWGFRQKHDKTTQLVLPPGQETSRAWCWPWGAFRASCLMAMGDMGLLVPSRRISLGNSKFHQPNGHIFPFRSRSVRVHRPWVFHLLGILNEDQRTFGHPSYWSWSRGANDSQLKSAHDSFKSLSSLSLSGNYQQLPANVITWYNYI